ncbi:MAG TPA: hotdog fold thioesterase [Anaerolineae bacterium]|nr:hotdog fold thioesterase [Anaerolineae bacterium]
MDTTTTDAVARFMSERDLLARHMGIELLELRPGYSRVGMTLKPYMVNGLGTTHGAAIFALADFAFATACNSHGRTAVALSMDVHFLSSPEPQARLQAEGVEVRCGQRTGLYRMTVTDENGNLVAELHGMAYRKNTHFLEERSQ